MTGAQFWSYLQQKIDKTYSAYLDNTKANSLIKESMYRMVDKYWRGLSFEREDDEMVGFMIRDFAVTPAAGIIDIKTLLPNYMHILRMGVRYEVNVVVTNVSGTTLTSVNHKLRKGNTVKLGVTSYTVTKVKGDTFDLGTTGLSTGTYKQIVDKEAKQMVGDRKNGAFHKADFITPRFESNSAGGTTPRSFKVTPAPATCTIDYVRTPSVDIDVANTTVILEDYYGMKFLYRLMDECVLNFGAQTKDYPTKQSAQQDIIENP
jgi:hypothetical protein